MNVSFTDKQEQYIQAQIASGDFQNASEVVRDAMRLHALYRERVLMELKSAISEGWNSPISNKSIDDIIEAKR